MANIAIPYLAIKRRRGRDLYYWQPSRRLAGYGWKSVALGSDADRAFEKARAINRQLDEWQRHGARPREVERYVAAGTLGQSIRSYVSSERFTRLAASTQREYRSCLKVIEEWGGDAPIDTITRKRVQRLKNALLTPAIAGGEPRRARTSNVLSVLYNVMKLAKDDELIADNPASEVGLEAAPPRTRVAADHEIDALIAAAERLGRPSIATAIMMAVGFGQREGDLLAATWSQWKDGRLRLRQHKTKVWVQVKAFAALRDRLDAAYAAVLKAGALRPPILINENTGAAWEEHAFQVWFRAVKAEATAPTRPDQQSSSRRRVPDDTIEPCPELADLQFRDFRRTAVVRLAEAEVDIPGITAITGHKLKTAEKILEVYMPRTTKMADGAIDKLEAHRARLRGERGEQEKQA